MSPDKLREVGEALYGPLWQTPMAKALGISVWAVQRWTAGEAEPGPGIRADLAKLCWERSLALAALVAELSGETSDMVRAANGALIVLQNRARAGDANWEAMAKAAEHDIRAALNHP